MVKRNLIGRGQVTIQDLTDSRTLLAYIGSTLQRQVIYNPNDGTYIPNYSLTPIELVAELYVAGDTNNRIGDAKSITWYAQEDSMGELVEIVNDNIYAVSGDSLIITDNVLKNRNSMTYQAEIVYPIEDSEGNIEDMVVKASIELVRLSSGVKGDSGEDGVGIESITEWYLASKKSEGVTATSDSGWSREVQSIDEELRYLWNYEVIEYTNGNIHETTPAVIGVHGIHGEHGVGIESIVEYYLATSMFENVTRDTKGWSTKIQTINEDLRYLWNYEEITYTDGRVDRLDPVILGVHGIDGDPGVGVDSIEEYYLASDQDTGIKTDNVKWDTAIQPIDEVNRYLWNYEVITYTNGHVQKMEPVVIGTYGVRGEAGISIERIIEYYLATSAKSGVTIDTDGWTEKIQDINADERYLWNYEVIVFSDETTQVMEPTLIGAYGKDGKDSYTHIAFADNETGTVGFTFEHSLDKEFMGVYVSSELGSEEDPSKYRWTKVRGEDGKEGDKGAPGAKGADGLTPYFHVAYANSPDGTRGFDTSNYKNKEYIGQYTDYEENDSQDPNDYSWTKIRGDDGEDAIFSVLNHPDGDTIRNHNNSLRIVLNMYKGIKEVTPEKVSWYQLDPTAGDDGYGGRGWRRIEGLSDTLIVTPEMFSGTGTYLVVAEYEGQQYRNTTTVKDIVDTTISIIGPNAFKNGKGEIRLTAKVYSVGEEVDADGEAYTYKWSSYDTQGNYIEGFKKEGKTIELQADEVDNIVNLQCMVTKPSETTGVVRLEGVRVWTDHGIRNRTWREWANQ